MRTALLRAFILSLIGAGSIASAFALRGAQVPMLSISPRELASGMDVNISARFPVTLQIVGEREARYRVKATHTGRTGSCAAAAGTIRTNAAGSGSWTCTFVAAAKAGTGSLVLILSKDGAEVGRASGRVHVIAPFVRKAVPSRDVTRPKTDPPAAKVAKPAKPKDDRKSSKVERPSKKSKSSKSKKSDQKKDGQHD